MTRSLNNREQILCNLNNEGGLQEELDIMPHLIEDSYLKAYPEERKARAFVEFAREGDTSSMIDILKEEEGDNDRVKDQTSSEGIVDLLRYQDPVSGMSSALHAAVNNSRLTAAWLLLWLASGLDTAKFPCEIASYVLALSLNWDNTVDKTDTRALRDSERFTANERALASGSIWDQWNDDGYLDTDTSPVLAWRRAKAIRALQH